MTDRWEQIEKICQAALDLEESQREAFLDQACGGDEELRREVESLLQFDTRGERFIEEPAVEVAAKMMAHEKPESLLGQQLGSYQIVSLLGKGGMGVVYQARDTRLNRSVAIKVLPQDQVIDPERKRRFIQEARAASALNHPNIITIYDIGSDNGIDFIAMEYVAGKTLDQRIPRHGMRLNEALEVAAQVADALTAAHEVGIVHRDLKPGNLMVTEKGQVKVLDFGLAKLTEKLPKGPQDATLTEKPETEEGRIIGTVAYMSPEQAEGKKVDARSDIFSFGSVLYEMFTGRRAFQGETKASTIAAILKEEPKPLSQVVESLPREVERIVRRCLRKDAGHRWQTMADLKVALEEIKEESDAGALETAGVANPRPRHRLIWILSVAAVLTIVAVGVWFVRSKGEMPGPPLTPVPLTSYAGFEDGPSFSPDGTQVAFAWNGEKQDNLDIYVKQIGVEPPSRLTTDPASDFSPAWSPDGQTIAFFRDLMGGKWALVLLPQRGGRERQLETLDVSNMLEPQSGGYYLAWTPDSKWLAVPYLEGVRSKSALFLISVETGEKQRLTNPPSTAVGDTAPAFSPDGHTLVFSRSNGSGFDLYLLHFGEGYRPQGEPNRVDTGNFYNLGAAWTNEGREIVFSSGIFRTPTLWRIDVRKPGKPVRISVTSENARQPSISRSGKRLAYVVEKFDSNIWRVDLEGPTRIPSRPRQLISSTKPEYQPAYSPDGKRIAFVSEQSGAGEIWICDNDGRNSSQLTSFGGPIVLRPSWSPDSQNIAFDAALEGGIQELYVVSAGGGVPRRLTTHPSGGKWSFWSHDGQWLYFNAGSAIWKMPSQGGESIQVTRSQKMADVPQESPNGEFLYYCRGYPSALSTWRIPIEGGEETKVLDSVHPLALWTVGNEGIYFIRVLDTSELCFKEFATGKIRKIMKMESDFTGGLAVSPDGRTILYAQGDEAGSDLMLVENFH